MPEIWKQIGASDADVTWDNVGKFGVLSQTVTVTKGEVLFPRIDAEKEIEELNTLLSANQPVKEEKVNLVPLSDTITIDDFGKIDLRIAEIKSCEKVAKSDKLLCLQLDDGFGGRQVVSGIAKWYRRKTLVGEEENCFANLSLQSERC
jgi:methionyl-tRNA synthetase